MAKKRKKNLPAHPERPKNISTKEELIFYLESNSDFEPPFYPDLWDQCVVKATDNLREQEENEANGIVDENAGKKHTNPCKLYFQLCGMPYNVKKAWDYRASMTKAELNELMDIAQEVKLQKIEEEMLAEQEANEEAVKEAHEQELADDKELRDYLGAQSYAPRDEIAAWISMFNKPAERKYLQDRHNSFYQNYEINEGADKTTLKRILSTEIELYRIDLKRAKGQAVNLLDEKKLQENLIALYESMKWTKKQRNLKDEMAQNKFTIWLDRLTKEGRFIPKKKTYKPDDIDFLLTTYIDAAREMMT